MRATLKIAVGSTFVCVLMAGCAPQTEIQKQEPPLLNFCQAKSECGFMDITGNIVVPPVYGRVTPFYENSASMEDNGKWGIVDQEGKTLVQPTYSDPVWYSEGLAVVRKHRQTHYLDKTGTVAFTLPNGASGMHFSEGRAITRQGKQYGVVDRQGHWIVKPQNNFITFPFKQGRALGMTEDGSGSVIVDADGKMKAHSFCGALGYSEGLAFAANDCGIPLSKRKYGFVDLDGEWIISPRYELVSNFQNGLAKFKSAGKWGFINRAAEIKIEPIYTRVGGFSNGLAPVLTISPNKSKPKADEKRSLENLLEQSKKTNGGL